MLDKQSRLFLYLRDGMRPLFLQEFQHHRLVERHFVLRFHICGSAKLLILDDLGTERNTDYALEKVYNIIDSRSRASKPMILTTNLSLDEMMDATDIRYKRIYDRILETCYPVEISGDSFRMQSAAQRFDRMAEFMEG